MHLPHAVLTTLLFSALGLGCHAAAENDEIELHSGESVYGAVIAQDDKSVTLQRSFWRRRTGVIMIDTEYSRREIVAMHAVRSLEEDYRQRAAACLTTYDARYSLARWCLDRNLVAHALAITQQLYQEDTTDPVTLELIDETGYVIDQGAWLTSADYAARHHLVDYAGVLMSPEEAQARTDYNTANRATTDTQSLLDSAQNESKTTLLLLRDATIALKRAERHQQQARDAEHKQHLASLTAEQLADEQEGADFDAAHGIAPATEPDSQELIDARADFAKVSDQYQQGLTTIVAMKARLVLLAAAMADDALSITKLSGKPFLSVPHAGPVMAPAGADALRPGADSGAVIPAPTPAP